MKTSDFDYTLPEELIAQHPLPSRDESKLLVLRRKEGLIEHTSFRRFPSYLRTGDVLVLNDTRVLPARLMGSSREGKKVDLLLEERLGPRLWKVLLKKPKDGMEVLFPGGRVARVLLQNGTWLLEFYQDADEFIEQSGQMPLPPYIIRKPDESDRISYQTVYAMKNGSIAAPTAGLHFTREILEEIDRLGVKTAFVTLHIGSGTFRPVRSEEVKLHRMHEEIREVPQTTADLVNTAKKEGRRVIAVGTTVVRALESSLNQLGEVVPQKGKTDLFIYPGYEFKVVDALLTNFHLPRSTLIMLVCAFGGREKVLDAYKHAVQERYRFLSYGDAMLII